MKCGYPGQGQFLALPPTESAYVSATAVFEKEEEYTLTLTIQGCGWVNADLRKKYYALGDHVTLTANPASCQPQPNVLPCCCCSRLVRWISEAKNQTGKTLTELSHETEPFPPEQVTIILEDLETNVTAEFTEESKELEVGPCQFLPITEATTDWRDVDDCGNILEFTHNGTQYVVYYQGKQKHLIAWCSWEYGVNFPWLHKTSDDKRFHTLLWDNSSVHKDYSERDEATKGVYNWLHFEFNCLLESGSKECLEDPDRFMGSSAQAHDGCGPADLGQPGPVSP